MNPRAWCPRRRVVSIAVYRSIGFPDWPILLLKSKSDWIAIRVRPFRACRWTKRCVCIAIDRSPARNYTQNMQNVFTIRAAKDVVSAQGIRIRDHLERRPFPVARIVMPESWPRCRPTNCRDFSSICAMSTTIDTLHVANAPFDS